MSSKDLINMKLTGSPVTPNCGPTRVYTKQQEDRIKELKEYKIDAVKDSLKKRYPAYVIDSIDTIIEIVISNKKLFSTSSILDHYIIATANRTIIREWTMRIAEFADGAIKNSHSKLEGIDRSIMFLQIVLDKIFSGILDAASPYIFPREAVKAVVATEVAELLDLVNSTDLVAREIVKFRLSNGEYNNDETSRRA